MADATRPPIVEADYVVAGAGSAGCALAARLSEDPSTNVLLLEAGGKDTNPWIHVPVGYFKTMHDPRTDWCYRTEPESSLNGRSLAWPRGKVLGGSSSINGLLYVRGQPRTSTTGASSATPAGRSRTCCPTSSGPRTRSGGRTSGTAPAAPWG